MGKHFLCQPMPRDRPSRTIRTPWLLARCSVRPRPPPSLSSPYRRGGLADAPSKTLSTSRARHAFSFLHRPPPYHTNTMASGEVLRATSPSAILKLTLQTRRSRRCTMMSERSIAGYWIRILAGRSELGTSICMYLAVNASMCLITAADTQM